MKGNVYIAEKNKTQALKDAFITYIRSERKLSALTVDAYRSDLEQWLGYAAAQADGEWDVASTTTADLRQWIARLAKQGMSHTSLRRKIQTLRAFFKFMVSTDRMAVNPAADIPMPKAPQRLPVYISPAQTAEMLDTEEAAAECVEKGSTEAFEMARDALILEVFYCCGLRCSELMDLTDSGVDSLRGELKVRGKRNKERIVPFGPDLSYMIDEYRKMRNEMFLSFASGSAPFFVRSDGRPLYRKMIYNIVHRAMERTEGINARRLSPHVLRHSFATDMLNGGASLSGVQQLLGHQSLTATQIYTHISFRELQQNYQQAHPRAQKQEVKS